MSDRPNDKQPDEPENSTAPAQAAELSAAAVGALRSRRQRPGSAMPGARPTKTPEPPPESWRVPTLPRDLSPIGSGGWHLPKPQDTRYSPEDESVITPEAAGSRRCRRCSEAKPAEARPRHPPPKHGEPKPAPGRAALRRDAGDRTSRRRSNRWTRKKTTASA